MASVIRGDDNFDSSSTGPSTTAGDVGTYAFLHNVANGAQSWGTTISASSLYPGALINGSASPDYAFGQTSAISESITLSGTWRIMGSQKNISRHMSMYVRIS